MPAAVEQPLPKIPGRSKWPKYTLAEQDLLLGYLGAFRAHACDAIEKYNELQKYTPDSSMVRAQIDYWQNVVSGIDWLASHVPHKQQHLALLAAMRAQSEVKA